MYISMIEYIYIDTLGRGTYTVQSFNIIGKLND